MATQFAVTPNKAIPLIERAMKKRIVPILKGSPGIGKSDIMRKIAAAHNLKLVDIRLAQVDPVELNGFPNFTVDGKATYAPMDIFPTAGQALPLKPEHADMQEAYDSILQVGSEEGIKEFQKEYCYSGWLLFFDEITSANRQVQAAAYKIILDHLVGQFDLHPKALCVAAGNLSSDKAVVNQMSTALQSRMLHLTLGVDKDEWVQWALRSKIDARVIAFIEFRKDLLHNFNPNHQDETFPCPRTWEFVARYIEDDEKIGVNLMPALAGMVSAGAASEFFTFCEIWQDLPSLEDIARDPNGTAVSGDSATRYATVGMLASNVDLQTIEPIVKYTKRMSHEFQLVFVRMAFKFNRSLIQNATFQTMLKEFRQDMRDEE
jgi:hypothetical protein